MILLLSCVFAIVVTAAGMLAADRMQVIVPVSSGASVSELALPIGHWAAVGLWTLSMVWLAPANRRQVIFRCIGVGFALHALILVALFVPRLSDRAAFSATVYLLYARAFCVMAIALSTAWLFGWVERMRTNSHGLVTLEAALVAGWVALLIAAVRYTVLMAVAGLAIGIMIAVAIRMARTGSLDRAAAMMRTIATDERAFLVAVFLVALGHAPALCHPHHERCELSRRRRGRPCLRRVGVVDRRGQGIPDSFSDRFPLLLLGHVWFAAGSTASPDTVIRAYRGPSCSRRAACVLLYDTRPAVVRSTRRPSVSAIFAAVSFPLVFAAATIGHQAVDVFLTTLIVWLLMRFTDDQRRCVAVGRGRAMVGFAFTVRETNIFLAAFSCRG